MLWVVPARVGGLWRTPKGDLELTQKFQFVTGTLGRDPVENGRLRGAELSFTAAGVDYRGRVDGDRMRLSGLIEGKPVEWTLRAVLRPGAPRF
jgi:hypothetical protein